MSLPALVISEGGERYDRARAVLALIGFRAVQLPAIFVPSTPKCQGTNGHRLAMRNAWAMIVMANVSMGIFEDDVRFRSPCHPECFPLSYHAECALGADCCTLLRSADSAASSCNRAIGAHQRASLLLAGARVCRRRISWAPPGPFRALHQPCDAVRLDQRPFSRRAHSVGVPPLLQAMWTTPRGAEFLLRNTEQCIATRGISIDTFMWEACSSKRLRCSYPSGHHGPTEAGGRYIVGFFHQDRKNVMSYLHRDSNKLRKGDPRPMLHRADTRALTSGPESAFSNPSG